MTVAESTASRDAADRRAEMARALARGGMENVQIISHESAEKILTPKRVEIIRTLRVEEFDSVRELARHLDRDKAQVSRDLQVLAAHAVIHYETDGRSKSPRLTQEHIIIEPVV